MSSKLNEFVQTIARLRGPDGCPWDREQTHKTLGRFLLEESYEVLEAMHEDDPAKLKEELGDLLLQIVLNAQIAKDNGKFDMDDVAESINTKMIRRHPHVFADATVKDADGVLVQWDELKESEKKRQPNQSVLSEIPKTLPALLQCLKISEKAVSQGFEWRNEDELWEKVFSELQELKQEIKEKERLGSKTAHRDLELELGDVLFTLVNVGRWHNMNAEESLILALQKFKERFALAEKLAPKPLKELTADEYEALWSKAKEMHSASCDLH